MNYFCLFFFSVIIISCSNSPAAENKSVKGQFTGDSGKKVARIKNPYNLNIEINPDSFAASQIEFGFMDKAGSRILIIADTIQQPEKFTRVLSPLSGSAPVSFIKKQNKTASDNGRQNEFNFENCPGYLYVRKNADEKTEGMAVAITTNYFLPDWQLFDLQAPKPAQLSPLIKSGVEKLKGRKIKNYKCLANIDKDHSVYLFEFELKKDSALASLVYVTPEELICKDYPAIYNEISTWQVDDGGTFGVEYVDLVALFQKQGKIQLIIEWPGAETDGTEYLKEEGSTFISLKEISRYISPE